MNLLRFIHKTENNAVGTLTLNYELRQKSRQRVTLDDGTEAGLFLERGIILREGDVLASEEGETVMIKSADEQVSTVNCDDALMMARASYHLGNRHVALQVSAGFLRYQTDHVLDELCQRLGLTVHHEQAPFEPEPGAYGDYGHMQGHSHNSDSESHEHSHEHSHPHKHDQ